MARRLFLPRHPLKLALPALAMLAYAHDVVFSRLAAADPLVIAAGRFLVAALVLWPVLLAREGLALRRLTARHLALTALAGFLLATDFATWIAATHLTTAANSLLLTHVAPVWVVVLVAIHRQRRPGTGDCVIVALSVLGAAIIAAGTAAALQQGGSLRGDLLAVASSLPAAGFLLVTAFAIRGLPILTYIVLAWSWAAGLLLAAALVDGAAPPADARSIAAIVAMALVAQLVGHGLMTCSLGWLSPCFVAVCCLAEPLLGTLLGALYFGEAVSPATLAGGCLILLAILVGCRGETTAKPQPAHA